MCLFHICSSLETLKQNFEFNKSGRRMRIEVKAQQLDTVQIYKTNQISWISKKINSSSVSTPLNEKWQTSDLAFSMASAMAAKAAPPSTNHWAWLPSSVKPLGGANEPKRWGWHQPSGGLRAASLIEATQSLTFALLFALILILRFPDVTWYF